MKKKLETDVSELETSLEHANAAHAETQRMLQKYHQQVREVQQKIEDESHQKQIAHDNLVGSERKANANSNALEEARTLLEQTDRNRRQIEQELADTNETLGDQTCQNQSLVGAKRKCEQEATNLHVSKHGINILTIALLTPLHHFRRTLMR